MVAAAKLADDREPAPHPPRLGGLRWAELMRRTVGFDVVACPRCGHRPWVPASEKGSSVNDRTPLISAIVFSAIADHEAVLADRLLSYLRTKPLVRIIGETTPDRAVRVPTISFVVNGVESQAIVRRIDDERIGIRYGDLHSRRLVERLDLQRYGGVVRASMVHYNTVEEIDRLILALDDVL